MNASKENARKMKENLDWLYGEIQHATGSKAANRCEELKLELLNFLVAAEKKLPSEASYEREKQLRAIGKNPVSGIPL